MVVRHDVEPGPVVRARAIKRFPPLLLERDALERFLRRAAALMPPGDVTLALAVRDGPYAASFASLRDLAADPDFGARLHDVEISLVRTAAGEVTHELQLRVDGRATLLALGDELWAYGALGALSELLAVYAKAQAPLQLAPTVPLAYFAAGFGLAVTLAAAALRGAPAALAAAVLCGAVWFFSDFALSEVRLLLLPPPPEPLSIDIRSLRKNDPEGAFRARLWFGLRVLLLPLWIATGCVALLVIAPHVPKHW